jgi:DNA-binding PadR family transcriptional regulator
MDMSTPLSSVPLHILLALSDGPIHGYGILQSVRSRSGGAVRLGTGSLYRHLSNLIEAGLVAEGAAPSSDPRRGTSYRLTAKGGQALAAERDRVAALLASLNAAARRVRRGSA